MLESEIDYKKHQVLKAPKEPITPTRVLLFIVRFFLFILFIPIPLLGGLIIVTIGSIIFEGASLFDTITSIPLYTYPLFVAYIMLGILLVKLENHLDSKYWNELLESVKSKNSKSNKPKRYFMKNNWKIIAAVFVLFLGIGTYIFFHTGRDYNLPKDSVYICTGRYAKAYHVRKNCKGLRHCGGDVIIEKKSDLSSYIKPCAFCAR